LLKLLRLSSDFLLSRLDGVLKGQGVAVVDALAAPLKNIIAVSQQCIQITSVVSETPSECPAFISLPDTHARFLTRSTCGQVSDSIARIRSPVSTPKSKMASPNILLTDILTFLG
jgi:hypothetical protein